MLSCEQLTTAKIPWQALLVSGGVGSNKICYKLTSNTLCLSSGSPWECTTGVCKCQLSEQSDGWQSSACQVGAVIPLVK